jgi:glycosyltransferase involved in cell wall biosynthesis
MPDPRVGKDMGEGGQAQRLVSVGIPTYNRPENLRKTLDGITRQTYARLEIVVSDNYSRGAETERVVKEFAEKDRRIRYVRRPVNAGMISNFRFVLEQSTGDYFLWVVDDDFYASSYIETPVERLEKLGPGYAAAIMEAQYFVDDGRMMDYFGEGTPFYGFSLGDKMERPAFMLKHNYGNPFYSVYLRDALFKAGRSFFDYVGMASLNEIPLFLFVAEKGNWAVLPEIGLFKKTDLRTYEQAKWEQTGGQLPYSRGLAYFRTLRHTLRYHVNALRDIASSIDILDLDRGQRARLKRAAAGTLFWHYLHFVTRSKRRKEARNA